MRLWEQTGCPVSLGHGRREVTPFLRAVTSIGVTLRVPVGALLSPTGAKFGDLITEVVGVSPLHLEKCGAPLTVTEPNSGDRVGTGDLEFPKSWSSEGPSLKWHHRKALA